MAGHGPAPKDPAQRRRRNATGGQITMLPAGGRKGKAPKWPIPLAVSPIGDPGEERVLRKLEAEVWAQVWKTPQAVAWEQLEYSREVAQYVRWKVLGELGSLDASKEARMLADRLGLTPMAMKHLLWRVDTADEVTEARERTSARRRGVKAVDLAVVK